MALENRHDMNSPTAPSPAKDPEDLNVNEVRQGVTGHGVRYVLMFSLSAALVALALAWIYVV